MSEPTYPLDLLRAELTAALAKQTVEWMDRFASKHELTDVRSEILMLEKQTNGRFNVIDEKLNRLLTDKGNREAVSADHKQRSARHYAMWFAVATLAVGLVGALAGLLASLLP